MVLKLCFFFFIFTVNIYSEDLSLILEELEHSVDTKEIIPIKKKQTFKLKNKINRTKIIKKMKYKPKKKDSVKLLNKNKNIENLFFNQKNYIKKEKKITDQKSFAIFVEAAAIISKEKYLSKTFIADINASGGNLDEISYYKKLSFASYYNLIKFFNPYFNFSYIFSGTKSTTTPIYYGLNTLNTLVSYRFFSFNFMFGSKFDIIHINKFLFSIIPLIGFAINQGSILMNLQEQGSLNLSDSYLSFGGMSFSGSVQAQIRFFISKKISFGLNFAYLYLVLNNVKITSSEGLFHQEYPRDSFLSIYNSVTKETEKFHLDFSGFNFGIFFEIKF